ncbi:Ribonuclease h domain [Thalictrum thalictroides]|uniref:Ribonuclease h domain n=1 Tax=Thalictrum thalictroides TaxID=46969 RepID=A0A7J6X983_THATH|nr:Ribonuclease h domain [Thalictrum thalictroides]
MKGDRVNPIDVSQLPIPGKKGNFPSIKLPKRVVEWGIEYCKFSLVGRLDLQSLKIERVREIASNLWTLAGDSKIIPLGKGFVMIRMSSEEDFMKVWGGGPWRFDGQVLRLQKWTPDFNPELQRQSNALVWVKFPNLKQQYWEYESLMTIGRTLGAPMGVDRHTLDRHYGYFASVLIDMDLSKSIPDKVLVEVENGEEFLQEVVISKLPKFCSQCKMIGHATFECRHLQKKQVEAKNDEVPKVVEKPKKKRNRRKKKGPPQVDVGTSGAKDLNGVEIPTASNVGVQAKPLEQVQTTQKTQNVTVSVEEVEIVTNIDHGEYNALAIVEHESVNAVEVVEPIGTFVPNTPTSQGNRYSPLEGREDVAENEAGRVMSSWADKAEGESQLNDEDGSWETPKRKGCKYKAAKISPHLTRSKAKGGTDLLVP